MSFSITNLFNLTVTDCEIRYTRKIRAKLYTIKVDYTDFKSIVLRIKKLSELSDETFVSFSNL